MNAFQSIACFAFATLSSPCIFAFHETLISLSDYIYADGCPLYDHWHALGMEENSYLPKLLPYVDFLVPNLDELAPHLPLAHPTLVRSQCAKCKMRFLLQWSQCRGLKGLPMFALSHFVVYDMHIRGGCCRVAPICIEAYPVCPTVHGRLASIHQAFYPLSPGPPPIIFSTTFSIFLSFSRVAIFAGHSGAFGTSLRGFESKMPPMFWNGKLSEVSSHRVATTCCDTARVRIGWMVASRYFRSECFMNRTHPL